mgnify:CR=1 FL=1
MHHNKLLNLLRNNAKKGEFRAEGNTIYTNDVIVSSKAEAEWLGGVDAETFVQTIRGMTGDVSLRINSPGGDVFAARAMAQAIRDHQGTVTAYVDGYAASAASFVTSVADKTVMSQGSMIMIHKAWSIALGNADDFMATAALLEKIDGTIAETYAAAAERRKKSAPDFMALMADETWLTAQEAIDAGLADEVSDVSAPKAKWDLSAYDKPPVQAQEPEPEPELVIEPEIEPVAEPEIIANEIERRQRINALRLREAA